MKKEKSMVSLVGLPTDITHSTYFVSAFLNVCNIALITTGVITSVFLYPFLRKRGTET